MALENAKFSWQKKQASSKSSGGGSGGTVKKSSGSKSSGSSKTAQNINKTVKGNADIDMQSVLNLGYGPISEQKLASLVASGEVIEYTMNGKTMFKKATKNTTSNTKNSATNKINSSSKALAPWKGLLG